MKKIIMVLGVFFLSFMLISCGNKDIGFGNYTYNYAYINVGDGTYMEIEIDKWKDYEDASVEITSKDGNNFLTSYVNVILSKDKLNLPLIVK